MKKFIALSMLILGMPIAMMAQDDDMYFVPKNKSEVKSAKQTYYVGSDRDIDEYNRRGKFASKVTPIEEVDDIIDFDGVAGVYPDSLSMDTLFTTESFAPAKNHTYYYNDDDEDDMDYRYSRQIDRWYGSYDPWFYGPGYWGSHFYWHSPYYYSHYYGFYNPWYYGGFYDPWYYGFGYYGWNGPWYTGWYGGWYNPWYDNYWAWHHYGYGGGISHGGIAGVPTHSRTSRGSASLKGYAAANGQVPGSRRNSYNDIAKRQSLRESIERTSTTSTGRGLGQRNTGYRENYTPSSTYNTGSRSSSSFSSGRSGGSYSGGGSRGGGSFSGGSRGGGGTAGGHGGRR